MKTVTPEAIRGWKGRLVDVRNLDEYAAERLANVPCECVPLDRLLSAAGAWDRSDCLLVICKSGMRSRQAAAQLESVGFTDVSIVDGGLNACKDASIEILKGRKIIPVQRQVMVVAGLILLLGLALAHVHPLFILIDWFVAAGLTMAGLTGFCPMARVLGAMPWNRQPACTASKCA